MNQTFQFRRLSLLLRLYFEENGRWYLTKLAIFLVICSAFLSLWAYVKYYESYFLLFAFILMAINGSDATTTLSNYTSKDSKGIRFLLLPASNTEKILVSLVVTIVFGLLNISLLFISVKLMSYFSLEVSIFKKDRLEWSNAIYSYALLVSFLVLGSIYFVKHYLVKLIFSLYAVGWFLSNIDTLFAKYIYNRSDFIKYSLYRSWIVRKNGFDNEIVNSFKEYRVDHIYLIDSYPYLIPTTCLFILVIAIWYASFLRLKEVEI